jgi:integrase
VKKAPEPRIRERSGRYDGLFEIWQEGKRKTISTGTYTTRHEAVAAWWKLYSTYADSPEQRAAAHESKTLRDWCEEWLTLLEKAPDAKKMNTIITYRWRVNHWIVPKQKPGEPEPKHKGFGTTRKLVELTPGSVKLWLTSLPLSHRSKRAALTTLSACLEEAKAMGLITINPARGIELKQSKAKKAEAKAKAWSRQEMERLLLETAGTHWHAAWVLGFHGAMRRGEILALRWEDVDWQRNRVHVRLNLTSTPEGLREDTPKSGEPRWVSLPLVAMQALQEARERQQTTATLLEGSRLPKTVVAAEDGSQASPRQLQRAFTLACKASGLAPLGLHAMRHTCASLLLRLGVSIVSVAEHLGHASSTITLATYAHFMDDDEGVCAAALQSLFGGQKSSDVQSVSGSKESFHPVQSRPTTGYTEEQLTA